MTTAAAQPAAAAARALPRWRTGGVAGAIIQSADTTAEAESPPPRASRARRESGWRGPGERVGLETMSTAELIGFVSKGRAGRANLAAATERHDHDFQSPVGVAVPHETRSSLAVDERPDVVAATTAVDATAGRCATRERPPLRG